jgi:hypothetical protein
MKRYSRLPFFVLLGIILIVGIQIVSALEWYGGPIIPIEDTSGVIWSQTYDGSGRDVCYDLVETQGGEFTMTGKTGLEEMVGLGTLWLVHTNSEGQCLWNYTYTQDESQGNSVVECSSGGYAVAGWIGHWAPDPKTWLVRTDADGNHMWNYTYGDGWAEDLIECPDGGFAFLGSTRSVGVGGYADYYLIRTDVDGNVLWEYNYGYDQGELGNGLALCDDGGFIMVGTSYSFGTNPCILSIRTDSNGNILWNATYSVPESYSYARAVIPLETGFLVAGHTTLGGTWVFQIDTDGNVIWDRKYIQQMFQGISETSVNLDLYSISKCASGGYVIVGQGTKTYSPGIYYEEWACMMRIDENGNFLWSQAFTPSERDEFYAVIECSEGGFAVGGTSAIGSPSDSVNMNMWLLRLADQEPMNTTRIIAGASGIGFALLVGLVILRRREKWPGL